VFHPDAKALEERGRRLLEKVSKANGGSVRGSWSSVLFSEVWGENRPPQWFSLFSALRVALPDTMCSYQRCLLCCLLTLVDGVGVGHMRLWRFINHLLTYLLTYFPQYIVFSSLRALP